MKITEAHQTVINNALEAANKRMTLLERVSASGKGPGTEAWNMFWEGLAQVERFPELFLDAVYEYANDNHINTVLQRFFLKHT